jgi:hypothetical protein
LLSFVYRLTFIFWALGTQTNFLNGPV